MKRRRRTKWETRTVIQCHQSTNVFGDTTCSDPVLDAFCLLAPNMFDSPGEPVPMMPPAARGISVAGIKFQAEHFVDPATVTGSGEDCAFPSPVDAAFMLRIWEALVVLPLQQGFLQFGAAPVPEYLPVLTSPNSQGSDFADRVLWKRITQLPFWGLNVGNGVFPQLAGTAALTSAGPQVVKSRVFLDDKHGLYYVRAFVHDVFYGFPAGQDPECIIPIIQDSWFKVYYKGRL